jgi:hypothetical protein
LFAADRSAAAAPRSESGTAASQWECLAIEIHLQS